MRQLRMGKFNTKKKRLGSVAKLSRIDGFTTLPSISSLKCSYD